MHAVRVCLTADMLRIARLPGGRIADGVIGLFHIMAFSYWRARDCA